MGSKKHSLNYNKFLILLPISKFKKFQSVFKEMTLKLKNYFLKLKNRFFFKAIWLE